MRIDITANDTISLKSLDVFADRGNACERARPICWITQHRRAIAQHDALHIRLEGKLDIADVLLDQPLPTGRRRRRECGQPLGHLRTTAFVLQRATEPRVRELEGRPHRSAILLRPVQFVTLALVFVGSIFATGEVTTVALTRDFGHPGAASLVIGVYALGSFVVGLILGALNLRVPFHRQLLLVLGVLLLSTLPLLLAGSVPSLVAAIFLSGVAVSPTFITAFALIERRVPPEVLTEGVTWVMTGIGIGMALGAFVTGWVVDSFGAQNGFWVSVAAAVLALLVSLARPSALGAGSTRAKRPSAPFSECSTGRYAGGAPLTGEAPKQEAEKPRDSG